MVLRTMLHPLRFRPTATGTLISLLASSTVALAALVVIVPLLLLAGRLFHQPWDGAALQGQSSILISAGDQPIRLTEPSLTCSVTKAGRQISCTTDFEGAILETTIVGLINEKGIIGSLTCRARFGDQQIPCEASHDQRQMGHPYVILHSDLGLPAARFQQLAAQSRTVGWTELDWLRLQLVLTVLVALALIERLWWGSRPRESAKSAAPVSKRLRLVYAFSGSAPLIVAFYLLSLVFLFSIGVID